MHARNALSADLQGFVILGNVRFRMPRRGLLYASKADIVALAPIADCEVPQVSGKFEFHECSAIVSGVERT